MTWVSSDVYNNIIINGDLIYTLAEAEELVEELSEAIRKLNQIRADELKKTIRKSQEELEKLVESSKIDDRPRRVRVFPPGTEIPDDVYTVRNSIGRRFFRHPNGWHPETCRNFTCNDRGTNTFGIEVTEVIDEEPLMSWPGEDL